MQRLLEACGFCAEAFSSGNAFLDAVQCYCPDCVLLDLHMLGLTGWEVMARMAAAGFSIPVIFITGDSDRSLPERAKIAGAVALLQKPVGESELLEAIAAAIG